MNPDWSEKKITSNILWERVFTDKNLEMIDLRTINFLMKDVGK